MRVRSDSLATAGGFGWDVHERLARCGESSLADHAVDSGDDAVIAAFNGNSKRADEIGKELFARHAAGWVISACDAFEEVGALLLSRRQLFRRQAGSFLFWRKILINTCSCSVRCMYVCMYIHTSNTN